MRKPAPAPPVPGNTDWERFDNAVGKLLSVPKEAFLKEDVRRASEEAGKADQESGMDFRALRSRMRCVIGPLAILTLMLSCHKAAPIVEGYRVAGYNSQTGEWTIIREFISEGEYRVKRMTLVCDFYKWGEREPVKGPTACSLRVGRFMVSTESAYFSGKSKDLLEIDEMAPDWMAFVEGVGADQVRQHFKILKQEMLSPTTGKTVQESAK